MQIKAFTKNKKTQQEYHQLIQYSRLNMHAQRKRLGTPVFWHEMTNEMISVIRLRKKRS